MHFCQTKVIGYEIEGDIVVYIIVNIMLDSLGDLIL